MAPESRALQKGTRLPFGLPNTPATFLKSKWTKTIKQKIKGLKPFRYRTKKKKLSKLKLTLAFKSPHLQHPLSHILTTNNLVHCTSSTKIMRNNAYILPPSTQMATTERQPNLGLTVFRASNMFCAIRMKIFQTKASMTHKGTYDWFRLFYFALLNPIQKRQPTNLITKLKKRLPKKE